MTVPEKPYRSLTRDEIRALEAQGCAAEAWSNVLVAEGFDCSTVRDVRFCGRVELGRFTGVVEREGVSKPAGVYDACLVNCTVGDGSRIAHVGVHLANYVIGAGVCIEDAGRVQTRPGATFGNGVEVEALNEGGGREIVLFNELSSQFAHLICLHRFRPKLIERLQAIAEAEAGRVKADRGRIGDGVTIYSVGEILDVNIGGYATVHGSSSLVNGTILSSEDAPTLVGADAQCEEFIIAEGTKVTGGAVVSRSYIGQGCQIGKQYSVEGSVFFANCEGFHGEACSIFAGPYTVTHHKSTLLIAGLFSFYNAGSGTNQSNHMYKLGPVHEGKLERGVKTGSFSYMMWPCRVGPFSVVLGKHTRHFDTSLFPFSLIEATGSGRCSMIPGLNLSVVGTVRDGAKWPARDRRKGKVKRDRISFDVFSPLTVGRMIRASAKLKELQETTDKSVDMVTINGAEVRRVILRSGQKFYRSGIHMYLLDKVVSRLEAGLDAGRSTGEALKVSPDAVYSEQWLDIGGQMMPADRLNALCDAVENGEICDLSGFDAELGRIEQAYEQDEWLWVSRAYEEVFGKGLDELGEADAGRVAELLLSVKTRFLNLILSDAEKEFGEVTRTGFGHDGTAADEAKDFEAVRGTYDGNKFVKQMREELEALGRRVERFRQTAGS